MKRDKAHAFALKDLRELSVHVVHAPDEDGLALLDHLRRIGCKAEAHWPPPERLPGHADLLFVAIDREIHAQVTKLLRRAETAPAVVAVVDYENPATLQLVLETRSFAVIGKPIRPFGLLANLVVARNTFLELEKLQGRLSTLEAKLASERNIAKAKSILMEFQGLSEAEAYRSLRAQAMAKRTTIEEIALAIVHANDLLNFRPDRA
ncbi:ANTAR domain-containing response regulator [Acuticoccus sp. I52.16.1]|uniref:ANTAR domain-containing response regulator n=1 Tax=Acuticoccus sp. I52.16.1 TaxID=2928472 RepID=UPI001FD2A1B6|nr:ANTAR domain-containing protein [Acuticoccus sp. I52.16.1]UOM34174.1 ANTAR domain-containing protein [Acuticoccus sp. I52.16.1]